MDSYYDRLGVSRSCSPAELQAAYRQRAWLLHPDAQHDQPLQDDAARAKQAAWLAVQEAYETLREPAARAAHDRYLCAMQDLLDVYELCLRMVCEAGNVEIPNPLPLVSSTLRHRQQRVCEDLERAKARLVGLTRSAGRMQRREPEGGSNPFEARRHSLERDTMDEVRRLHAQLEDINIMQLELQHWVWVVSRPGRQPALPAAALGGSVQLRGEVDV